MKNYSLFALGLGCALAVLPLTARAQVTSNPTAPTDATPSGEAVVPAQEDSPGKVPAQKLNKAGLPVKGSAKPAELSLGEKKFMRIAAGGNAAEVQLAEHALKSTENPKVKEFAEAMIKDHTAANTELLTVAQKDGMANFKAEVSDSDKATYAKMTGITGTAFDTAYIKHAVADHETDVKEYKEAMKMVKDPLLKEYVEKTTPIVEGHLKMAKELASAKF